MSEHPRAAEGYAYAEPADVIGATVQNADQDAIYLRTATGRRFVVGLGTVLVDNPFVEYGLPKGRRIPERFNGCIGCWLGGHTHNGIGPNCPRIVRT